ncbi:GAF domain-containing protein [Microcella frigidaquae]|uniref:GAF domain-containing protein n=1 Tax=Microcella frigidaquae TaxID=424758 RepID=A0A840X4G1_9MICO|nr:GAF domain-containing protein [Microcella frigidaquae]NHN45560.1 GAF domain-containing protein [Microcella frigidaquae]
MSALSAAALHIARPAIAEWAEHATRAFAAEPRPVDQPRAVADGPAADRILLVGGGAAVGRGQTSHDLALPGALARALRARTRRGVVVDVIADPLMTIAGLAAVLTTVDLGRYDAVITTVGDVDALRGIDRSEWRERVATVVDVWRARVGDSRALLITGIPSLRDEPGVGVAHGRLVDAFSPSLNAITDEVVEEAVGVRDASPACGQLTVLTSVLPLAQRAAGRVTTETHTLWAGQLAAELVEHLPAPLRDGESGRAPVERLTSGVDDAERIAGILDERAPSLERIVTIAAAALNVPTAVVTVLGPDTQWHVSRFGLDLESVPIEQSFCAVAVRQEDGMVVPDAPHDPRFAANPLVTDAGLRYYAGVPIEDEFGRRIGALCVIDTKPRNHTSADELATLRRLAEKVEEVLHTQSLAVPTWIAGAPTSPVIASPATASTASAAVASVVA